MKEMERKKDAEKKIASILEKDETIRRTYAMVNEKLNKKHSVR